MQQTLWQTFLCVAISASLCSCKRKGVTGPITYDKVTRTLRWAPKAGAKKNHQESSLVPLRSAKAPRALRGGLLLEAHKTGIWLNAHYAYLGKVSPKNKKAFDATMRKLLRDPRTPKRRRKIVALRDGRVEPSHKEGKTASAYRILPVVAQLRQAMMEHKLKLAKHHKELGFNGRLGLLLDESAHFRLISELMLSAGWAEYGKFDLVVCADSSVSGACNLLRFAFRLPPFSKLPDWLQGHGRVLLWGKSEKGKLMPKTPLVDILVKDAFIVSIGSKGTTLAFRQKRFPQKCQPSKMPPANEHKAPTFPADEKTLYKDLARCLAWVRTHKPAKVIVYMAEPEIPVSRLVRHLEANIKDGKPLFRHVYLNPQITSPPFQKGTKR